MKINTPLLPPHHSAPWSLVFLGIFLGALDSDTGSASPLIFHSHLSTSVTTRSLRKQKYLSSYMKVLFVWEKRTFSNCSAGRNECPKYGP